MVKEEAVGQEAKSEVKQVESTLMIESTKQAFKLPDGEIVEINDYLVWLGNLVYLMGKELTNKVK